MDRAQSALDAVECTTSCLADFDALAFTDQGDRMLQLPMTGPQSMWMNPRTLSFPKHGVGNSTVSALPNFAPEPENLFDTLGVPTYYQRIQLTVI